MSSSASNSTVKRKGDSVASVGQRNGSSPTQTETKLLSRAAERADRESLVLWRKPIKTLNYFIRELFIASCFYGLK